MVPWMKKDDDAQNTNKITVKMTMMRTFKKNVLEIFQMEKERSKT